MDYITSTATAAVDVAIAQGSYAKAGAGGGAGGAGGKAAVDKDAALLGPRPDLKVEHIKFVVRKVWPLRLMSSAAYVCMHVCCPATLGLTSSRCSVTGWVHGSVEYCEWQRPGLGKGMV